MLNVFCISGTVINKPELTVMPYDIKRCEITIAVKRPYANAQGIYEDDLITLETWRGLADIASLIAPGTRINATGRVDARINEKRPTERPQYAFVTTRLDIVS